MVANVNTGFIHGLTLRTGRLRTSNFKALGWLLLLLLLDIRGIGGQGQIELRMNVTENSPKGAIGTIDLPAHATIVHEFWPGEAYADRIEINHFTGVVSTKVELDREDVSRYKIGAVSSLGSYYLVTVYVIDINDNSPVFSMPESSLKLAENTPTDAKYPLGSATDLDLSPFTVQRYEIVEGNVGNVFRLLTSQRDGSDTLYLDLAVIGPLDADPPGPGQYNLLIKAFDGGSPPLTGSMRLNITIVDTNDNTPTFNQSRYFAQVKENATIGTSILQVFATDLDSGDNGHISYHIDRSRDQLGMFDVNPQTGNIYVNKQLDYEKQSTYEVIVVAKDNGSHPLQSSAIVSISVLDVNDNQPTINLTFFSDDGTATISEDANMGDFVARVSVSDPDAGTFITNINVTLSGGNGHFGLTKRDSVVYLMVVKDPPDREMTPSYMLTITATDSGSPPLYATSSFVLKVLDANDNAPKFNQSVYYADIQEHYEAGALVTQLTATDLDEGNNSVVSYKIIPTPQTYSQWFEIDSRTGVITTRTRVDCETYSQPQLLIQATDSGKPPLSSNVTVIITIRDVNDNNPVFDQSFYNVSVRENTAVDTCILTVSATDPDCGVNAKVTYQLQVISPSDFYVKSDSGEICIKNSLDYERENTYQFSVLAKDVGNMAAPATIKISVLDVNDNHPIFYPSTYNVNLDENSPQGRTVAVVHARDDDSGAFGDIKYRIVSGNSLGLFAIQETSGIITLQNYIATQQRLFHLQVEARDGGGLVSAVHANVTVSVTDANQQPPSFRDTLYSFAIDENASIGATVGTVEATNSNPNNGAIFYSIESGDPKHYFDINTRTGVITTRIALDHDVDPSVLLNIQAQSGNPPVYGQAQVDITIRDINDNTPQFLTSSVEISVKEDTGTASTIYSAHATDKDSGNFGKVKYRLLQNPNNLFQINADSGHITLQGGLDYEAVKQYSVVVQAYDQGNPSKTSDMTVNFKVQDVNDNDPVFNQSSYSVRLNEATGLNTKFLQVGATDRDSGNNKQLLYRLNSFSNQQFGIFSNDGWLYLREALDRETQDLYNIQVVAVDNGIPPRSSTASLTIHVDDANDITPEFQNVPYTFQVPEKMSVGTFVGQVSATDGDKGVNKELIYAFVTMNDNFNIGRNSGTITTKKVLDRETKDLYDFSVLVRDNGTPSNSATVTVTVQVQDMNDNSPVFMQTGEYKAEVVETGQPGTYVITVSAYDIDDGANGSVSYLLESGGSNDFRKFTVNPGTGVVRTREALTGDQYSLTVVAQDAGTPPRRSEKRLRVEVIKDTITPVVTIKQSFTVNESIPIGSPIGKINIGARDPTLISYYLMSSQPVSVFGVNTTTGVMYNARDVDYEQSPVYRVVIKAMNTYNGNTVKVNVTVNVIDLNDNAPVFDEDPVMESVVENVPIGSTVYRFTASDHDSGNNGKIAYSIVSQSPSGSYFAINRDTGDLTTTRTIDHEVIKEVSIIVKATDQATDPNQRKETTVTTLIRVIDLNDNYPEFVNQSEIHIFEDEPVGYPVMFVIAVDKDAGQNGNVTYTIVSGNDDGHFALDPVSSMLTIAKALDRELKDTYILNVTATDHGQTPKSRWQKIRIHVDDVNDNPPKFENSVYRANISENLSPGVPVIKVKATDRDLGANGNLTYLIPRGIADNKFAVHPQTGQVTTEQELDREDKSSYVVTVYVRDGAYPAQYDTATIIVNVLDQNDHVPVFKNQVYRLTVPENSQNPIAIHTVVAMDEDSGTNGQISYAITEGNEDSKFSIYPDTGEMTCRPLDRESKSQYQLTITATDHGNPPQTGTCSVLVAVQDQNDNNPIFGKNKYTTSIYENATINTAVIVVNATDADFGKNALITYTLDNDSGGLFKINNVTGAITTAGQFDREKKDKFVFEVNATDGALYDPRSQKVTVEVTILDVNDNAPIFTKIPFSVNISADVPESTTLTQIRATDADEAGTDNTRIVYSIVTDTNYFVVNLNTGSVFPKRKLDGNAVGVHQLKIKAIDSGNPQLFSYGVLSIRVGNPSVSTLRFTNLSYSVYIQENTPQDTSVVRVQARFVGSGSGAINYNFASGSDDNTFKIHSSTGVIRVNDPTKLDYETTPRIRLIVIAASEPNPAIAYGYTTVWVTLTDRNDNTPHFAQEKYTSRVWEGNPRGTYVTQVSATDADSGQNKQIWYSITKGNPHDAFIIDPPHSGLVKTNTILDREIQSFYKLEIEAKDHGDPQRSSTCTLRITVVDVNDNEPFFPSPSPVNVSEDTEKGTIITTITANDVDLNPQLTYDFTQDGNPDGTFSIDRYTGAITLAKKLDHEKKSKYTLSIEASDTVHIVKTNLTINIIDENDNNPQFLQQSYEATLPELTPPGYSLIQVRAKDEDSGDNARVTYSIEVARVDGFYVDPNSGIIYTNKTIRFNSHQPTIQLVITAKDHGTPVLDSVVAVRIRVTDINDHSPEFEKDEYSAHVSENEKKGATIIGVIAHDDDNAVDNQKIDYSLVAGNNDGLFQIITNDSSSIGHILLVGSLDRETKDFYSLQVVATDRGTPRRNTSCTVKIYVDDINDHPPKFTQDSYVVTVNESLPSNVPFLQVSATDDDIGSNKEVEYSITSGNDDGMFAINSSSGVIRVSSHKHLDSDIRSEHRFTVRAQDSSVGQPRLSAYATVLVNVTDINDHKPKFPVMMYLEKVKENQPVGTTVFTAHATDGDTGIFGRLSYQLTEGTELFKIDENTGDVVTQVVFDYEATNSYRFKIIATDLGGLQAIIEVMVNIESEDEFAPVFESNKYNFKVPGNARKGDFVGQVHATDRDTGPDGEVVYKFDQDEEYFTIDYHTGNITVKKPFSETTSRKKRFVPRYQTDFTSFRAHERTKRELTDGQKSLLIMASSPRGTKKTYVITEVEIDYTCVGCNVGASTGLGEIPLVLIIVFAILAVILIIITTVVCMWSRERRKRRPSNTYQAPACDGSFDSVDLNVPPNIDAPPRYIDVNGYERRGHNPTTSEISDQSHSSSGRGSADDQEDEDEEITRINQVPQTQLQLRGGMPDSGIQQDDDNISEHSVQNHEQYFAKLGIDTSKIKIDKPMGSSVESMHQFSDEGGGEGDGLDIGYIVNAKLGEVEADEDLAIMDGTRQFGFSETEPSHAGSLSSVINSEEEFSGSYNWDYLLDWGPQYQPLAHVFAEIARLKDETFTPKKVPTQIVSQRPVKGVLNPPVRLIPPPLITNAPPFTGKGGLEHQMLQNQGGGPGSVISNKSNHSNASNGSSHVNSTRTSQMTLSASLPRSPISHESTYTSPALSPSFTPTLSPLATRSPSVSPLVTPHGGSHSGSGHSTPHRNRSKHSLVLGGSSESELELRI